MRFWRKKDQNCKKPQNSQWSVVRGQWSGVSGQWSVVRGQWSGKYFVLS
ncbi:MAG: hypothetical protein ACKPCI_11275 [Dolichospermum sp.]